MKPSKSVLLAAVVAALALSTSADPASAAGAGAAGGLPQCPSVAGETPPGVTATVYCIYVRGQRSADPAVAVRATHAVPLVPARTALPTSTFIHPLQPCGSAPRIIGATRAS